MAGSTGGRTLSRDFKDVRRHTPVAVGHGFTGWVGLGIGLTLGLSVALAVHLYDRQQRATATEPVPTTAQAPASEVVSDDATVSATNAPDTAGSDLEFYDVLPRQEVEVPEQSSAPGAAARTPLPTGDAVLQAGSFKQSTEAEKMQAQLALLGVSSKIQRASVDDETWYRVRIGPIETVEDLRVIQAKLREAEISAPAVTPVEDAPLP
jgi:cell division protein FtsN